MRLELTLPCKLTDAEVMAKGQELAVAELHRKEAEEALASSMEEWKSEKKARELAVANHAAECQVLARVIREREEDRPVECVASVAAGQFRAVRLDTGELAVERAATQEEMQMSLDEAIEVEGAK
jgi:hypothetical protein